MKTLVLSWEAVPAQTIVNCLQQLHDIVADIAPEGVISERLVDVDNEVITTALTIKDDDILRGVTTNQQEWSDEDDDTIKK